MRKSRNPTPILKNTEAVRIQATPNWHHAMPRARLPAAVFGRNCALLRRELRCTSTYVSGSDMPPVLDWRSAAAYAYLDNLSPAELAWEFLRRNPDYQRDYRAALRDAASQAEFPEPLILRWGLRFRGRSGSPSG
jgi:hypothetical protein